MKKHQQNKNHTCERFREAQLIFLLQKKVSPWKVVVVLSLGLLLSGNLLAQQTPAKIEQSTIDVNNKHSTTILKGAVNDSEGKMLIGAHIRIKGTAYATASDIDGNFQLLIPKGLADITLAISFTGYETLEVKQPDLNTRLIAQLKAGVMLDEVSVVAYHVPLFCQGCTAIRGITKSRKSRKVRIVNITEAPIAHTYPNPFEQSFALKFDAPKDDVYLVNLYDIAGKLAYTAAFELSKGKQNFELHQLPNLAAGNYVVQVSSSNEVILAERVTKVAVSL